MLSNKIVLVDRQDIECGTMEKLEAHQKGLLHRAFSVFIFNNDNELLIHQRNFLKYHSGGLWSNTCCGHPRPNENVEAAAFRRLEEEMGFTCVLEKEFDFIYKATFGNGLIEHEFDHVFSGVYNKNPIPNIDEVSDYKWINWEDLLIDVEINPEKYTFWFKKCLSKFNENKLISKY